MTRIQFRRLDGILLLDKSTGMSSNAALQVARRLFRAEKLSLIHISEPTRPY